MHTRLDMAIVLDKSGRLEAASLSPRKHFCGSSEVSRSRISRETVERVLAAGGKTCQ
jgi:hypothetical protein